MLSQNNRILEQKDDYSSYCIIFSQSGRYPLYVVAEKYLILRRYWVEKSINHDMASPYDEKN